MMLKLVHALVGILALGSTLAVEEKKTLNLIEKVNAFANHDRHEKIQHYYSESNLGNVDAHRRLMEERVAIAREEMREYDMKAQEELKQKREERKEQRSRTERKATTIKNPEMFM
jgi:hypothetical protein